MRSFFLAAAVALGAVIMYGLLVVGLFRFDARDLQVDGAAVVVGVVLWAVPFAAGAWSGTRSGLRDLAPRAAALRGCAGALLALLVVSLAGGGSDAASVLVPLVGIAAGTALGLRRASSWPG